MCGIAGLWSPDLSAATRADTIRAMTRCIAHRGPDADGVWLAAEAPVALGHRRLAIIDLTESGAQPMASRSGRWMIVFNGEIYNYRTLRDRLARQGVSFRGSSDTEVLLAAIEAWGIKRALQESVGMFAFGLWDRERRELHLARDRIGEKPLHYAWLGQSFAFASELKALRAHPDWAGTVDRNALALFLRYTYVPAPLSIYDGVRKVLPGTYVTFAVGDECRAISETTYWSAVAEVTANANRQLEAPDAEVLDALESQLSETISGQMISDVPLGAFLSGGTDSSLIVALMQRQSAVPVRTFTIGFSEDSFDEAPYAKAVAAHLGTTHTEHYVSPREALDVISLLPQLYDEPLGDSSQIPTYLVSKLARQHVTVALSGDGGDELFGGYSRYAVAERAWERLNRSPRFLRRSLSATLSSVSGEWSSRVLRSCAPLVPGLRLHTPDKLGKLSRFLSLDTREDLYRYVASTWDDPASVVLAASEHSIPFDSAAEKRSLEDFRQQMMLLDLVSYLPDDIMVKVDRAAMGVSLETRAPFLDHRVVELAARLPSRLRVRDGISKWALRQLLLRQVPAALVERPKMGFAIPVGDWLRGPLRDWAEELLGSDRLRTEGYFNARAIREVWEDHLSGRSSWTGHLWPVLMFQAWLDTQSFKAGVSDFAHADGVTSHHCVA